MSDEASQLRLYNTLTNKEEVFEPLEPGKVRMYTCGPTVYGRPHIGNYSSFLMADLLRRWLEHGLGYQVAYAKNITDVGHLVADADEGEDKVEKQAKEEHGSVTHESVIAIARKYEDQYKEDETSLNMIEPDHRPRASEYIEQMTDMINLLLDSGRAYITDDGIYFSVESFDEYGKLSGNTLENLDAGARVAVKEDKKHPADFALWKFCVGQNEHHALRWPSPGEGNPDGFPGWHIECSAMSSSLLGDQIDVHTGGEDNIFPHHECEIAQSECSTGKQPFVKYWLHRRRIDMGSEKMSKSLGNVLSIPDIVEMGYSPLDLRYAFLSVHYRTQLKFTKKVLEDAHKARRKILEWMDGFTSLVESSLVFDRADELTSDTGASNDLKQHVLQFIDAMNADLNTPGALAALFEIMSWSRNQKDLSEEDQQLLEAFIHLARQTFGCFDPEESADIPADVQELVDQRAAARESKNFEESDRLRDEIRTKGYEVRDGDSGQEVKKL